MAVFVFYVSILTGVFAVSSTSSLSNQRIIGGIKNKSLTIALTKVKLINNPILTLGGWVENNITKNPKNKIRDVKQMALPVSKKVICNESSTDFPLFRLNLYLLKK